MAIGLVQTGGGLTWFGPQVLSFVDRKIVEKLHQSGAAVVARAQQLAPVKTGELRAGIDYQVTGKTLMILSRSGHGLFVEMGTRYMVPHPHIRPALNEIGRIWGGSITMQFNAPVYANPIYSHQAGFVIPKTLTAKQRAHVQRHLLPTSKRLFRGNVRRAGFRAR